MNIVITGGPGAGKTTLIEELRARNYRITGESGQIFMNMIEGLLLTPQNQVTWRDLNQGFSQLKISDISLIQDYLVNELINTKALSSADLVFTDRGLHDSFFYMKANGIAPTPLFNEVCQNIKYDWVFILDPPPPNLFKSAPGRIVKTHAESLKIGKGLEIEYNNLKANGQVVNSVVNVPWNCNRIDTIFNSITPSKSANPLPKLKTHSFLKNFLVSIDQVGNALSGGDPAKTVSARVGYFAFTTTNVTKWYWKAMEKVINFTFWPVDGMNHCWKAYSAVRLEAYNDSGSDILRIILLFFIFFACIVVSLILYPLYAILKPFGITLNQKNI